MEKLKTRDEMLKEFENKFKKCEGRKMKEKRYYCGICDRYIRAKVCPKCKVEVV